MTDNKSATPLFAQVRDTLKANIAEGHLAPGDKLPSEAALEQRFGVSRVTIRQALAELQKLDLIDKVNGKAPRLEPLQAALVRPPLERVRVREPAGLDDDLREHAHQKAITQ